MEAILLTSRDADATRKRIEAALSKARVAKPRRSSAGRRFLAFCLGGFGGACIAFAIVFPLAFWAADHNICHPGGPCGGMYPLVVIVTFLACGAWAEISESRSKE